MGHPEPSVANAGANAISLTQCVSDISSLGPQLVWGAVCTLSTGLGAITIQWYPAAGCQGTPYDSVTLTEDKGEGEWVGHVGGFFV